MAYTKILLDTNTYLRLGNSIRPLLGAPFGKENYALFLHKEIQTELNRSSRLKNKFYWVNQEEHIKERKKIITLSKIDKKNIDDIYEFIWNYQNENNYNLSREDIYCLATALALDIILATDDTNMKITANEYEINILSTLELLKIMVVNKFIERAKVEEITQYWKYNNDFPANYYADFARIFGK